MNSGGTDQIRRLEDIVSVERLQALQDAFASAFGITTVVIDFEGNHLTRASNLHGFCHAMQEHPRGVKACRATNAALCERNRQTGRPTVMTCPNSGLRTAAVPIMVGGECLASWVIRQVKTGPPDKAVLRGTVDTLGLNYDEMLGYIEALPLVAEDEFDKIFNFLTTLSSTVISVAKANSALAQKVQELSALTDRHKVTSAMLREFVDSGDIGMYITDYHTGEILMVNRRFAEEFEVTVEGCVGKKCWVVGGPKGGQSFCAYCPRDKLLDEDGQPNPPYRWENLNPLTGSWLRCTNQALRWVDGRLAHMVTYMDVTLELTMREELSRLAFYDNQMSLPNRQKLLLDMEAAEKERPGVGCLVCFDINALRRVNEVYGRKTGDLLLDAIQHWVAGQRFFDHNLYRVEGDLFALFMPGANERRARAVARQIYERFTDAWCVNVLGEQVNIMCDVSVAVLDLAGQAAGDGIFSIIERTIAASREAGKVVVHNREMDSAAHARTRLELSLRSCVRGGMVGFDVHYQPIVDPAAGTWKGLEALCRWTDPETGPVSPLVFIHEAEHHGLIRTIGLWVLERAISQAKSWGLDKVDGFFMSVNLSPSQVMDENLVDNVTGLLRRYDYPGEKLYLEITESSEFAFNSHTLNVIDNLRFRGVHFSLDDFGTGYSSFNNLKNLPVSVLKTEREFIVGVEDDPYMQFFFYTIAELAHAADMRLIAEGVETQAQLDMVLKNGANYIQGYYFSKPLTARQLEDKLDRFVVVDTSFYRLGRPSSHEGQVAGRVDHLSAPRLFKLLNRSIQLLLGDENFGAACAQVLEMVGRHMEVAMGFVLLAQPDGRLVPAGEWNAAQVRWPQRTTYGFDAAVATKSWQKLMRGDRLVVAADIASLPQDVQDCLQLPEVCALAALPIEAGKEHLGLMVLCDTKYRGWLPDEITMLRNLCMTMASCLKRANMQQQIQYNDVRFSDVLNHMDLAISVADPATGQLLWVNDVYAALSPGEVTIVGRHCYELLYGRAERCAFCKVPMLQVSPFLKQHAWEAYNEKQGKHFMVNDSLVQWGGGRRVHLQYCQDITASKQAQHRLETLLETDPLTGALNRNAFIEHMHTMLINTNARKQHLAVVFVDFDHLKTANDTYGHSFGDRLLVGMVKAIRQVLPEGSAVGRYGDDEFVALVPGCGRAEVAQWMEHARELLADEDLGCADEGFTFSYGVAGSGEFPGGSGNRVLNGLINLADDRMRGYKHGDRPDDAAPQADDWK